MPSTCPISNSDAFFTKVPLRAPQGIHFMNFDPRNDCEVCGRRARGSVVYARTHTRNYMGVSYMHRAHAGTQAPGNFT